MRKRGWESLSRTRRLWLIQGGRCFYCQAPLNTRRNHHLQATLDHVLPRAEGGDRFCNVVLACRTCNNAKGSQLLPPEEREWACRVSSLAYGPAPVIPLPVSKLKESPLVVPPL